MRPSPTSARRFRRVSRLGRRGTDCVPGYSDNIGGLAIRRGIKYLPLSLLSLLVFGCHYPGTWEDDPGNWKRVYGSSKPDDVVVLHSYYWRSSHWSLEFCYAFQFQANEKLREGFFKANTPKRVEGESARAEVENRRRLFTGDSPAWLLPKDADRYEVWEDQGSGDSFRMFIDTDNGDFFVTGEQI